MCSAGILTSVKSQGFSSDVISSSTSSSLRTTKQNSSTPVYIQKVNWSPEEFQHSSGWTLAHVYILGVFGEHKHLQTSHCSKQTEESSHIRVHSRFLDSSSKVLFGCRPAVPRGCSSPQHLPVPATQRPFSPTASGTREFFFFLVWSNEDLWSKTLRFC